MHLGLVACTTNKLPGAHTAETAYTSRTFRARVAHVKKYCDQWRILSSVYGLIRPDRIVYAYDTWLRHKPIAERKQWQNLVLLDVLALSPTVVTIHAGAHYYDPVLRKKLLEVGIEVRLPTEGMSICNTYSHLKTLLED